MRFRQDRRLLFVLLLVLLWSPACQFHYRTRDWSKYEGPGNPLKPLNRGISASHQSILVSVVGQPLSSPGTTPYT
jgi:hypothetical protein